MLLTMFLWTLMVWSIKRLNVFSMVVLKDCFRSIPSTLAMGIWRSEQLRLLIAYKWLVKKICSSAMVLFTKTYTGFQPRTWLFWSVPIITVPFRSLYSLACEGLRTTKTPASGDHLTSIRPCSSVLERF